MRSPVEPLPDGQSQRLEDRRRRDGYAGIDQHRRQGGEIEHGSDLLARAAHHPRPRIEAHRHVGAGGAGGGDHGGMTEREAVQLGEQPQGGRRIRRAAADPGRHRQLLVQPERSVPQAVHARGEVAGRAQDEVVVERPRRPGRGTGNLQREVRARYQFQHVGHIGEGDEALQRMVAVARPAAENVQGQVDLGRSAGGEQGHEGSRPEGQGMRPALGGQPGTSKTTAGPFGRGRVRSQPLPDGPLPCEKPLERLSHFPGFLSAAPGGSLGAGAPFGNSGLSGLCGAATGAGTA
jgi:hypothetical protein